MRARAERRKRARELTRPPSIVMGSDATAGLTGRQEVSLLFLCCFLRAYSRKRQDDGN
jgi:hypothetical protein